MWRWMLDGGFNIKFIESSRVCVESKNIYERRLKKK